MMCLWRMRHFVLHWIQGSVFFFFFCGSAAGVNQALIFRVYSFIIKALIDEFFHFQSFRVIFFSLSPALMLYQSVCFSTCCKRIPESQKYTFAHAKDHKTNILRQTACASHLPKEDVKLVCACVVLCNTFQPKQKPLYHCSEHSALIPLDQNVN